MQWSFSLYLPNNPTVSNAIDSLLVKKSLLKVILDVSAPHIWSLKYAPTKLDVQNGDKSMAMDMSSNLFSIWINYFIVFEKIKITKKKIKRCLKKIDLKEALRKVFPVWVRLTYSLNPAVLIIRWNNIKVCVNYDSKF